MSMISAVAYDESLAVVATALFNSDLVRTKVVTIANIGSFTAILNGSIPTDAYGCAMKQWVNFSYQRNKDSFYGHIEKSDMRHYLLLAPGLAIAGYFGLRNLVKIELTGDRYSVEPIVERNDNRDSPRRTRGGRNRGDRNDNRGDGRNNRNDNNRNDNNRNDNNNRGGARRDNRRDNRNTQAPRILGVNTEVANMSQTSQPSRTRPATYADKLKSRYGAIPPISVDIVNAATKFDKVEKKTNTTALEELDSADWNASRSE